MNPRLAKWRQISTKKCCENEWIKIREDVIGLPDGTQLNSFIVVEYCGAVGVLAIEQDKILLVKQYRYPINKFTLEIPAGAIMGKDRTSIIKSAREELLEEAGYNAKSIKYFYRYHPSPGSSNEVIHLVIAKGLNKSSNPLDKDKSFDAGWYKIKDVVKWIASGKITHSPTIIGVLLTEF